MTNHSRFTLLILIKPLLFSLILLISITPALSLAKSANYNILKQSISELKKQNRLLQEKLDNHEQSIASQNQHMQRLQASIDQNRDQAQKEASSASLYRTFFQVLALLASLLALATLYLLSQKYLPLVKQHKALIKELEAQSEQHQSEIDELKQKTLLLYKNSKVIEQKIATTTSETDEKIKYIQDDIEAIHQTEKASQEQISSDLKTLDKLLKTPLMHGLSAHDIDTIQSLLEGKHLDFISSLKAKALIAEHHEKWQDAIQYWDTILIEKPKNNEALLHIGFANFKLATEHRKEEHYLNTAVSYYDQIMTSAPEYFEDVYGFDDQTVGPDEIDNKPDELWLYQQVEKLIIKTDELRNYHAILNIACEYSAAGNIENARECLEQISAVYHAPNYKQLQEDKDLDSIRDQDWFKKIIKEAGDINSAEHSDG